MRVCSGCLEVYGDEASFCPDDGTALWSDPDPLLGRTVASRYRLVRRLGQGGTSRVYLAKHVIIGRMSAIKILREMVGDVPANRERFLREARAVNRINHPNIVEISDVGEADGIAYLVMEYVEGTSLLAHIQKGPFAWPRAIRVAAQVASALGRAHQLGVIHRDLKPENVMLLRQADDTDFVKLTDFGIAKILDLPALTFSEQLFGTPGYIAPEFVEGIPCDHRVDLYSLGVLLYEMLTGALPFEARGQADLLLKPLSCDPIAPSTRVANLPPALEALVLQLLQRDREKRPADAAQVQDALLDLAQLAEPDGVRVTLPDLLGVTGARAAWTTLVATAVPDATTSDQPPAQDSDADDVATQVRVEPIAPPEAPVDRRAVELAPRRAVRTSVMGRVEAAPAAAPSGPERVRPRTAATRVPVGGEPFARLVQPGTGAGLVALGQPARRAPAQRTLVVAGAQGRAPSLMSGPAPRGNFERWQQAVADLEGSILRVRAQGRDGAAASQAEAQAASARVLITLVERGAATVATAQAAVDALHVEGREFRATLGHAIDSLLRDRSRGRARLEALRGQRVAHAQAADARVEGALWALAELGAEEARVRAADVDLSFQVDVLQRELDRRNTEVDRAMLAASATLEGALAAYRQLSRELAAALDEGARLLAPERERRVRPLA